MKKIFNDFMPNYHYFRGLVNAMYPNTVPECYKTVMFSASFSHNELIIRSELMTNIKTYLYVLSLDDQEHFKILFKHNQESFEPFYARYEKFVKYHVNKMDFLEAEQITDEILRKVEKELYYALEIEIGVK